jgi:Leucine-rich repeat (LRR) protein
MLNVDFSYNNITSLGAYTIRKWMILSLRYLNVSNNALRTLKETSFIAQSGLEVIDFSCNELEYISEKTFMYIPRLKWLSLANNRKLKILDGVPFLNNNNFSVLHLEECGLYRLSLSSFNGLSNLRELYLSHNKIRTVEMGAGSLGLPILKIRYLELTYNKLQEVPRDLTQLQSL